MPPCFCRQLYPVTTSLMSEETPRKRSRPHVSVDPDSNIPASAPDALPPGCDPNARVLSWLLGEQYPVSQFLRQYWEKKPLVVHRGSPGFYGDLFSRDKAVRILNAPGAAADAHRDRSSAAVPDTDGEGAPSTAPRENTSRGFRHGRHLRVCRYAAEHGRRHEAFSDGDLVTADVVQRSFDEGATVQFFQPQRFVDALWRINAGLEALFSNLVGASAYLTPPGSQGLAPHHDDVEVFILQTEGSKRWKLYDPVDHDLPSDYSQDLPRASIGEPIMEVELQQGDMLYMPRGVVHEASTPPGTFSTHVTLSTYQHSSWSAFLEALMPVALERAFHTHRAFREGLPVRAPAFVGSLVEAQTASAQRGGLQHRESFHKRTKQLLAALVEGVHDGDIGIAMDRFAADFVANRLPPPSEEAGGGSLSPKPGQSGGELPPACRGSRAVHPPPSPPRCPTPQGHSLSSLPIRACAGSMPTT